MTDYITTFTGVHFYPQNPKAESIHIEDIAHALSLITRGNGHVKTFFSVAEHSINCAKEAKARGYNKEIQLICLLHDAAECYMSDVPSPFKPFISDYNKLEDKLLDMIFEKFLGRKITEEEYRIMKEIDHDFLYYDLLNLLDEKQDREAPEIKISFSYEVRAFDVVEKEFLSIFEELIKV